MDVARKITPAAGVPAPIGHESPDPHDKGSRRWAIALCSFLLAAFAGLAWSASLGKSPTYDEPAHALSGWLQLWQQNDRLICDHPPLWSMLAAFATAPGTIRADLRQLDALDLPVDRIGELAWINRTLFQTPGNDAIAFIRRFRAMMLAAAVGMGALLSAFVWRIARASGAGPLAATAATVFATGLFALDPNFLAHSPLMKDDAASALAFLALIASTWATGRALTPPRLLILGTCCGAALMIKLNAPLMIATSMLLLLTRALAPWPWLIRIGRQSAHLCDSRIRRIRSAVMCIIVISAMTFAITWLSYGFRFAPARAQGSMLDLPSEMDALIALRWQAMHGLEGTLTEPTMEQLAATPPPLIVRLSRWADHWHLLPQAFITGVLFTSESSHERANFLLGHFSNRGTWWYFPFTMAVKTPLATLTALIASAGIAARGVWNHWKRKQSDRPLTPPPWALPQSWTILCLILPVAIYLGAAMATNLNLGIRHVLTVYPPLFALAGLALAKAWDWRPNLAFAAGLLVLGVLAVETCCAYPDFIPFFNALAGGSRGGLALLSDSNLDWGQDLPLLADWQKSNPDVPLYLAYFGSADPAYYGIRYTDLGNASDQTAPWTLIKKPGVLAISATTLQGTYARHFHGRPAWSVLWGLKPLDVLGGSIYLFRIPPNQPDRLPTGQWLIN
jgi:hypothetical protein